MSDVFSIASHWALLYLIKVVTHEQTGCAHFSAFEKRAIQNAMLVTANKRFCSKMDTLGFSSKKGDATNPDVRFSARQNLAPRFSVHSVLLRTVSFLARCHSSSRCLAC